MASPTNVSVRDALGRNIPFVATAARPVVESDTATFPPGVLYIGTGGDLVVETTDGTIATFVNIADATFFPVLVKRIYAASTCADIVLLY